MKQRLKHLHFIQPDTPISEYCIALRNRSGGFGHSHADETEKRKIAAYASDDSGTMVAGLIGEIINGRLYMEDLWVSPAVRNCGVGTRLLKSLEEYAKKNRIVHLRLHTSSAEALAFYRRRGYRVLNALNTAAGGRGFYRLKKEL